MKNYSPFKAFPHLILFLLFSLCYYLCCCAAENVISISNNKNTSIVRCINYEREALIRFKQGIQVDNCGLLSSWKRQEECCKWRGVGCNNSTNHVTTLHLHGFQSDNNCLQGNLSSSLTKLKHLRYLDLSFNSFSQPIPSFIGSLKDLEYLNLSNAGFVGRIPDQLGNLSKLEFLDVSSKFYGSTLDVKSLQWLSRLSSLRYLDFTSADLGEATNWMNVVSNLPFLSVLRMNNCNLPAKIPSSLAFVNISDSLRVISLSNNGFNDTSVFQWLFQLTEISPQLQHLDLSFNQLQGLIPSALGNLQHLSHLDLSNNLMKGPLPREFWNMHSLKYLDLSGNNIHGGITRGLSNLCNLQILYLGENYFTGELSNVIHALTRCANKVLVGLDLSQNQFWGSIPDIIGSFTSLKELYLDGNHINGKISQRIGELSSLEKLDISSSSLRGTLTHRHFMNLSRLRELYLSDNPSLVMNISGSWVPPFQLDIISLRSCKLGPHFPKWLQSQTNFSLLDTSNADISGVVPASFWNSLSSNLQLLNMSYNKFYGVLPDLPGIFELLSEVDLSSNYFEGEVPSFLKDVSSLYLNNNMFNDSSHILCPKTKIFLFELDLSSNLLSGDLPDCWMNLDQLTTLHLENNKFTGNIPKSMSSLNQLQYLHLHNNNLSGQLPVSLQNCSSLVILSLGYNSLTGRLPPWIGNSLQNLGALILRENNLSGELPLSLCQLSNLQILDLAMNHFSGMIPRCINKFTAMTKEEKPSLFFSTVGSSLGRQAISTNVESGIVTWKREEQRFKASLMFVKYIDLSQNELHAEIPNAISELTGLVSLDLSRNKLSGSIPSDIGQLTALELLDLSNNYLKGEIPISLAKVSSLAILNLSNNNLSGEVPLGSQLQTFDASSFTGNPGLCGAPLPSCSVDQALSISSNRDNSTQVEYGSNEFFLGLYISVLLGFILGFWGVCGTLVLNRSWRLAYSQFLDNIKDRLMAFFSGK